MERPLKLSEQILLDGKIEKLEDFYPKAYWTYLEEEEDVKVKLMTKEEILQQALQSALSLPVNDKNRVEILMKYADLAQLKKDQNEGEEQLIHYYLPLTCNNCSLYMAAKAKKK